MKKTILLFILFPLFLVLNIPLFSQGENFSMRELSCNLSQPWEITFGPDDHLWATEAHSYKITRIDPVSGNQELLIDLSDKKNFPDYSDTITWPQGGLQGLVFHPDFESNPYVYVAYVYQFDGCLPNIQGCFFQSKIVRYNYDMTTEELSNEMVIVDTLPGSTDHNGGRLVIGPISEGMDYLFYSIGDMGAGQLGNANRAHHGQNPDYYEGKILRFNLEPDSDLNYFDSWIPNDNPFNTMDRQNAVWSLGHRNPQGLAFSPEGILYESEHGPYSDDEVNIILPGYNYGFPLIMGFTDGNYNGSSAGDGPSLPVIDSEEANEDAIELSYPYGAPLGSYFDAPQSTIMTFYQNDVNDTPPYDFYFLQNPTIAPSDLEYYDSDAIPGWENSLLLATLKYSRIFRLELSSDGLAIVSDTIPYFGGFGRYRDIAISEDGTKIYVATDSTGFMKGAPGVAVDPPIKGCILEFTYNPTATEETMLKNAVSVYPNPVYTGDMTLQVELDREAEVSAALYSSSGQMLEALFPVESTSRMQRQINMSEYQSGSYFIKVSIDGTPVYKKLIRL